MPSSRSWMPCPSGSQSPTIRLCSTTRLNRALARQVGLDTTGHASLGDPPLVRVPLLSSKNGRRMTLEDRPMYQAANQGIEVSGVIVDVERPDGSHVTLMEYAAPLFNRGGHACAAPSESSWTSPSSAGSRRNSDSSPMRARFCRRRLTTRRRSRRWLALPCRCSVTTAPSTSCRTTARSGASTWSSTIRVARSLLRR